MSFPTDCVLKRRTVTRKTAPDPAEAAEGLDSGPPHLPAPPLVALTDPDVPELTRQGRSRWSGPLAFKCGA